MDGSGVERSARDRELFDRVARDYARKDLLPAMRVARKRRTRATWPANQIEPVGAVLDVGCGAGFAAQYLDGSYQAYIGVDYSTDLIGAAQELNTGPGRVFHVADATTFRPRCSRTPSS